MTKKIALITGITGQDGAILAQILLEKGYDVHGMRAYSAVPDTARLDSVEGLNLHYGDMIDGGNLTRLLDKVQPNEIYNLAAQSHVHVSFDVPEATANINALGTLRLLEAIRHVGGDSNNDMRLYQASSSEMFGRSPAPQNEDTKFDPCSPYATAKLYAHHTVKNYREAYGLHASNGILFNHESALRGEEFVTRKITKAVCEIEAGLRDKVTLGNLESMRDWGHAHDYMRGAWMMVQQETPADYILASGQSHSVRAFVEKSFAYIGVDIEWQGDGVQERGLNNKTGHVVVDISADLFRPTEVHHLLGDATKAKNVLGWQPEISFDGLIEDMMNADRIIEKTSNVA